MIVTRTHIQCSVHTGQGVSTQSDEDESDIDGSEPPQQAGDVSTARTLALTKEKGKETKRKPPSKEVLQKWLSTHDFLAVDVDDPSGMRCKLCIEAYGEYRNKTSEVRLLWYTFLDDLIQDIYTAFSRSTNRLKKLEEAQTKNEETKLLLLQEMGKDEEYQKTNYPTLKNVCATRWLSRHHSIGALLHNLQPLLVVLETEVPALYKRLADVQTIVLLFAFAYIVDRIAGICKFMQAQDLMVGESWMHVHAIRKDLLDRYHKAEELVKKIFHAFHSSTIEYQCFLILMIAEYHQSARCLMGCQYKGIRRKVLWQRIVKIFRDDAQNKQQTLHA